MGKKTKICSADHIVLNAAAEAYTNLGSSDTQTLRYLLENKETGFLTYYYLTGNSKCSSECRAQLFALAISALGKINYFFVPAYMQITAVDTETPPAYIAYLVLLYLLQLYVEKIDNACKEDYKKYTEMFCTAFKTIDNGIVSLVEVEASEGVVQTVPVLNLNLITATAHYLAINIGCTPISITNAQIGGVAYNPAAIQF